MGKLTWPILASAIYLLAVALFYFLDLSTVLSILSVPWSLFLIVVGGLISHTASNIDEQLAICKVAGSIFNVLLYLLWVSRSNKAEH